MRAEDVLGDIGEEIKPQNVIIETCCFWKPQLFNGKHYEAGVDHDIEVPFVDTPEGKEIARQQIAALRKACTRPIGEESSSESDDFNAWTVDDLAAECERLGITVERADGGKGAPLKADYVRTLEEAYKDAWDDNNPDGESEDDDDNDNDTNTGGA